VSTWRLDLRRLGMKHDIGAFSNNNAEMNEVKMMKVTEEFQALYPGNYKLDWKVNTQTWTMELTPIFENEKDSNWWYLKYG
jgi:hypothetical protein